MENQNAIPNVETFLALEKISEIRHAFIGRIFGIGVNTDRENALARLANHHLSVMREMSFSSAFITAEQVHGNRVATVDAQSPAPVANCDALITATPGVTLGIYVADCCAVYIVDPKTRCIGLAHSGKKGTESRIVPAMIERMETEFGARRSDMIVQLSPCIRPPFYEIDIAREIVRQCREMAVSEVADCGICTAANVDRYYSYRVEKGKTGRMLALLSIA